MNGMVLNSWPYVIAAFGITWAVLLGYSLRLVLMTRRLVPARSTSDSQS